MERVRIVCTGDGTKTKITDADGKPLGIFAYEAHIHLYADRPPTAEIKCHMPSVAVRCDAEITEVCPHCGRPAEKPPGPEVIKATGWLTANAACGGDGSFSPENLARVQDAAGGAQREVGDEGKKPA